MAYLTFILCALVALVACSEGGNLTCRDADGSPVDWFYLYKLPRSSKAKSPIQKQGAAYAYITSAAPEKGWTISSVGIDSRDSMPARTLAPMYDPKQSDILRVLYNDDTPSGKTSSSRGHTKGVLLAQGSTGIWLVHSVPHYPPEASSNKYTYPDSGRHFGQSFICLTVPLSEVDKIGLQLQFNEINLYDSFVPPSMANLTNVTAAISKRRVKGKVYSVVTINTLASSAGNGVTFTSYAKTSKFGKDLYADLVAVREDVPLIVQSWRNGPGVLPSFCNRTTLNVYNLRNTSLWGKEPLPDIDPNFTANQDHSKWTVSFNSTLMTTDKKLICVGDINRAQRQEARGGGTVCVTHPQVWESYFNSVKNFEKCQGIIDNKGIMDNNIPD